MHWRKEKFTLSNLERKSLHEQGITLTDYEYSRLEILRETKMMDSAEDAEYDRYINLVNRTFKVA